MSVDSEPLTRPNSKATAKKIGVLGSPEGWYFRDLQRAANQLKGIHAEILCVSYSDLSIRFLGSSQTRVQSLVSKTSKPSLTAPADQEPGFDRAELHRLDRLVVRSMPLGSLEQIIFRMDVLHSLAEQGIDVRNSPRCLEAAIDKWRTLDLAQKKGLEIPYTICCQTRQDAMEAFDQLGGDCVVKPIFGGEGRGIVRVSDRDMAWRVFSTLEQLRAVCYVQEFLESDGYDLRLLVIGEDILCVRRESRGDWRSNVARGGVAIPHEPSFEQISMAYQACKAIGGWMIGVDILQTKEGRNVLLELNAVPGWRATAASLNVDIAQLMLHRLLDPTAAPK